MGGTFAGLACAPEQGLLLLKAAVHSRAPGNRGACQAGPEEWGGTPGRLWVGSGRGAWRASGSGPSVFNSPVCRRGSGKGQAVRA